MIWAIICPAIAPVAVTAHVFDGHGRIAAATEDQPAEDVDVFGVGASPAFVVPAHDVLHSFPYFP